jgi:WD40 repeat protein
MSASYRLPLALYLLLCAGAACADAQAPALVIRAGGTLTAMSIAVSPDGKWFASEAQDGAITIWSTDDGSEYRTFQAFPAFSNLAAPGHLAVASDATTILVLAGPDLHLVDVSTARELRHFTVGEAWSAWQIAANPKQMVAAIIDQSGNVNVLSLADGSQLFHLTVPTAFHNGATPLLQVRFSPDGRQLAIAADTTVQLWDWAANRRLLNLDAHSFHKPNLNRAVTVQDGSTTKQSTAEEQHYFWFTGVSFSPDGKHLALSSHDELNVLNLPSGSTATFASIDSSMVPGCIFATNDLVLLPQLNLDLAIYSMTRGMLGTATNVYLREYVPVPGRDRSVMLAAAPYLVTASTLSVVNALFPKTRPPESLTFTPGGAELFASTPFKPFAIWDLESGEALPFPEAPDAISPALSNNGKYLAVADALRAHISVFELAGSHGEIQLPVKNHRLGASLSFSADGNLLGYSDSSGQVSVFSIPQKNAVADLAANQPTQIALQPDGSRFAVADRSGTTIYSLAPSPARIASLPIDDPQNFFHNTPPNTLRFSPDGKWLAIMEPAELRIVSTATWTDARKITAISNLCVAFSPDSRRIAVTMQASGVEVVDLVSGNVVFKDNDHLTSCPIAFNKDGTVLAAGAQYSTELFSMETGKVLANLYLFSDETQIPNVPLDKQPLDWLVVTPDGLFDGTPTAWNQLSWRFSEDTFSISPVEIFFQSFYHPGLLAEIASGKMPRAPTNIADIDRRQPQVALSSTATNPTSVATRIVHLELAVSQAPADEKHPTGSGANDLRLFRNGTLVQAWRSDLKLDASGKALFSIDVPIVAGENRFTAYAFNSANIKSSDASLTLTGADSLKRPGTAWVVSMGINHYAASTADNSLDLKFAEGDATDFASLFSQAQSALRQFGKVRRIDLLGPNATKANLQTVFRFLAGASPATLDPTLQQLFAGVAQVQPEDGVFLFYAGHGAALDNHFYLIPQDYNPGTLLSDPRSHTVSDVELSQMLEGISPARSFLIIDACNSGQAIDSSIPVGPMNATGLAQLAYEKGLYIMAASKNSEPALEAHELGSGHGFLTYALVDEGIKAGNAAENGVVELRPWFVYASRRVPEMQAEQLERRALVLDHTTPEKDARQHPRIFYRREPEPNPFIVAKTAPAGTPTQ